MPRFFIDENTVNGDIITITGGDATHIGRSLRMRVGENITFCREGMDYETVIEKMTSDSVICRVTEKAPSTSEPDIDLKIFQALPKQDKAELIIQKCVELGASEIVFFISKRCVSRPDEKSAEKKITRYSKIAEEAAKQSGRGRIPVVRGMLDMKEAVEELCYCDLPLFCYENGGKRLSEIEITGKKTIGVMIGSEGGFDRDEMDIACERAIPVWLGKRILRCETCPIAVTSVIMNITGNF